MSILLSEMPDDFDDVKMSTHMIKSDAETSLEILNAIIENMDVNTNLNTNLDFNKKKNIAELFDRKIVVGNQKTKITITVERLKNTKSTFQVSYDIELPKRPLISIFILLAVIVGILSAGLIGLGVVGVFYFIFSRSDGKKIKMVFPIKSIIHDAISKLEKIDGHNNKT